MQQGFGKTSRLLVPADFQRVFQQVAFRLSTDHLVVLGRHQSLGRPRLGLVMTRKNNRRAVDRNRTKRIARETFRRQQANLGSIDYIVMARRGVSHLANDALRVEMQRLWDDASRRTAPSHRTTDA